MECSEAELIVVGMFGMNQFSLKIESFLAIGTRAVCNNRSLSQSVKVIISYSNVVASLGTQYQCTPQRLCNCTFFDFEVCVCVVQLVVLVVMAPGALATENATSNLSLKQEFPCLCLEIEG